jgi:DNA-binding Lrp family transcriptional regulator
MSDREAVILAEMRKAGVPMKPGDIAEKAGLEKTEVSKIITKLKKEGKIMSPKRCFYAPTDGRDRPDGRGPSNC